MSLSRKILDRLARLPDDAIPAKVLSSARLHLLDVIGVGLVASASSVGKPYRTYAEGIAERGAATILGFAHGVPAAEAALVNGGLIHSLEFDDTHTGSIVHGSSVLAATALACGEAFGASGLAVVGAYVRWYEIFIRLGLASAGGFQDRGFQLTSVGGAICAAGIAAELSGADTEIAVNALGIALSQSSGVFEFLSNGSTVKSLHPGWAAHSGILAARLAGAGMTGPETAFEGRFGLFVAFAGDRSAAERLEAQLENLGRDWLIGDVAFKFHPCCHYLHPFIEAAERLLDEGLDAGAVAALECVVPPGAAGIICEPWHVKQAAQGHAMRWSLPRVVASRLADGPVTTATFESTPSTEAQRLAQAARWRAMEGADFPARFEAELIVSLSDGRQLSARVEDAYGNRTRPAPAEAVKRKFDNNLAASGRADAAEAIAKAIGTIDGAASLSDLSGSLRAAGRE